MKLVMNNQFLNELKELLDKHQVTIESFRQYDGNEEYCGTDYIFRSINGVGEDNEYYIYIELNEETIKRITA